MEAGRNAKIRLMRMDLEATAALAQDKALMAVQP